MITSQKLIAIAKERGLDTSTLNGRHELLKEVLRHQSEGEAMNFLVDTFMMLDDEIEFAFDDLGLSDLTDEEKYQNALDDEGDAKYQLKKDEG